MEQTHSFYGRTSREALAAVKHGLGDDAVIITTRERPDDPARRFEVEAVRGTPSSYSQSPSYASAPSYAAAPSYASAPQPRFVQLPSTPAAHATPFANDSALLPPRGAAGAGVEHKVLEQLEKASIDPTVRARLYDRSRRLQLSGSDAVEAMQKAIGELVVGTVSPWQTALGQRRILGFVGPTGSGKTTTIAKVAAQALLQRRKVALITTDTFRVGASFHLARYGEIMGLSTYVAETEAELLTAVEHARGADLVLIDCAGRSPRALRDGINLHVVKGIEVHLVVPATASAAQLTLWRQRHKSDEPVAVIATKLDEADGVTELGGIITTAALLGLPLAATADGQTVPDDIAAFDPAVLWRRLSGQR
ncbi:MAG TPA: hypothetical protein VGF99_01625 [Myxococcota bacterium]